MDSSEIFKQVTEIFKDVLDNEDILLARATTAHDVEDWDSLTHIELTIAIEKHFKLRFISAEIRNWKNVGEMCDTISSRLAK
jgi:acyl carrier protein